ncbi:MAG: FtsQ-type POTRA domain-containing protein [Mobilicoccus sp.]|nr:FtsQ-type POTRA domain-containing protein [Mobilicoccus sp.]
MLLSAAAVVAVVAGIVALLWLAPFLRVESVEYRTASERVDLLRDVAAVTTYQPLVEVDTDAIERRVLAEPVFGAVDVSRSWPSTLVVSATPREPVVAVSGPGVRGYRLVDSEGVSFETVGSAPDGIPSARVPDPDDRAALTTLATVTSSLTPDLLASADALRLDESGHVSMELDGVLVTWGGADESRLKTAVVRELVAQPGVERVDVSAPLAPITSDDRAAGAVRGPTEGPVAPALPATPTGAPTDTPTAAPTGEVTDGEEPDSAPTG